MALLFRLGMSVPKQKCYPARSNLLFFVIPNRSVIPTGA
jgi:hypothetical protein